MSWEFPKRLPRPTSVISPEDHNESFRAFENKPGSLNEHNFDTAMRTQLTRKLNLADDVAMRVGWTYEAGEAERLMTVEPGEISSGGVLLGVKRVIRNLDGWQPVPDSRISFVSGGGDYLIWAGGGYAMQSDGPASNQACSAKLSIAIDGTPYPDLVLGSLDDQDQGVHMEKGISGLRGGYSIMGVVHLPAGAHTVELVCDLDSYYQATSGSVYIGFGAAPILVVELHR